jgi:CDP-glucose 4,6-dehydratase
MSLKAIYQNRKVLVTGHTGFKGAWLTAWLHTLGAKVSGLALPPESAEWLFPQGRLDEWCDDMEGDIRDAAIVAKRVAKVQPDVVLHLAAQPLVRESYDRPVETAATNIMGTIHLLDALRFLNKACAVVIVTSDKCYENREVSYAYREDDPMGGHDVYSASKGCAELMVASYRRSFFSPDSPVAVASARAGNVIGPGDWARDRIVPDAMRSFLAGQPLVVRNPDAVRPWQHVLEPLSGYLWLAARLMSDESASFREAWNFGPEEESARNVASLADLMVSHWPGASWTSPPREGEPHEATLLQLDIAKARERLAWRPVWGFDEAVAHTVRGYRELMEARADAARTRAFMEREIQSYSDAARAAGMLWTRP